ncbi:uncharacterized protein [Palaemon carinicauda]|uniref:uncharacterized protein n=1 Tax=Palaemon carinicauda TaxID=392227 RepID=UPI0035B6745B
MSGARYSTTPRRGTLRRAARGRINGGNEDLLNAMANLFLQQRQSSGAPSGMRAIMPDKCSYEMSQGAFRKWRRSMTDWFQIGRVATEDAVLSIRLNCDDQLQRALDACYTADEWKALSLHQALDAVQEVTQKSVNRAILWDKFFSAQQGPMEPAKTYVHRCQELALDCAFRCPQCQNDMSDYMLTHRLVSGLNNCRLKQEILQDYEKYNSVAKILQKCEIYEAAERDSGANKFNQKLITAKKDSKLLMSGKRCDNCGRIHEKNKSSCYANEVCCHNCGIKFHLARYCRKKRVNNKAAGIEVDHDDDTMSVMACTLVQHCGVQQVTALLGKLPYVRVKIEHKMRRDVPMYEAFIDAIADTGAEVCIMGEKVLHQLGLNVKQLHRSNARVNHAAEKPMRVLGSVRCTITLCRNIALNIEVLVVCGVSRLYLSIDVFKCLGLVDANFPHHVKVDGISVNNIGRERPNSVDANDVTSDVSNNHDVIELPFSSQEANVPKLKRETHHTFAPFDMASGVPVRSYKTVIDAYSGFHQVELDEESRHLTTFISPWGRYQYCRTPMGHVSASDAYSKRFDDVIADIPRKSKCVDDVLLYDDTVEGAFYHTISFLQVGEENGVTLNPEKFQFCQREVDFVGYELGWDNFKPGEEKLSAIKNFPMPNQPTITDIRSCCEEDKVPFCCKGGWKLALCGSRHLTSAEVNYAVVEGEASAMVWCFQKARLFLLGCPNIILVTDHRPLVKVFGDRELKDIANPRLLRLKEKTLQYSFTVKYIPGKKYSAADTLSRYPVIRSPINASDREMGEDVESSCVAALMTSLSDDVITLDWNSVKRAAESDVEYQLLKSMVAAGSWPVSRNLVDSSIKPYFSVRDRLGIVDELVVYSYDDGHIRLAIPVSLRDQVVSNLHSGHQSSDSMIRRARQAVYWPGMEGQLKLKRMQCRTCDVIAPSQQREPLLPTPPPEYPFQQTVTDMFQMCGKQYLVYADRLTGWLEIAFFPNGATSAKLIPLFR